MLLKSFFLTVLVLITCDAFAEKPSVYSHWRSGAIKGYDVVAYHDLEPGDKAVKGSKDISYEWNNATWRFSSKENLLKFKGNPEKYIPAYGGYCAFAVSKNFTIAPRPNNWDIVDGKLYLNNNKRSHEIWRKDKDEMITEANKNWPNVLFK